MKKLISMLIVLMQFILCAMPIMAVDLSSKLTNMRLNDNIKLDLEEIGEITNFKSETLDSFKYEGKEYDAIVIADNTIVNNSKDEFFTSLNLGQVVHVYGTYKNDTNRVVIGWKNMYGTVNESNLNDVSGGKLDTLEDLNYIGDTYRAKIGMPGVLLKNSKGQEIIYIPSDKVIDVYGKWAEDNSKLVVEYNGIYGIIPANGDYEKINTKLKNTRSTSTDSILDSFFVIRTDYDAVVVGKTLPLLNYENEKEEIDIVPEGSQVHVYGKRRRRKDVLIIKWNGVYGYVEAEYLKRKEELEDFDYTGREYNAVVVEDASILDTKIEKLSSIESGEKVNVYGDLENDSNYAVVGWKDLYGLVEKRTLDKIEKNNSLDDFKYSGEEYEAEVVDFPLAFRNNKGYLIGEVPIGTKVHVYGIWENDKERAVISWNGMIGTVIVRRLKQVIINETLEDFQYTKNEYDAIVVEYNLVLRNTKSQQIGLVPAGDRVHVHGIWAGDEERAVIEWGEYYGTVKKTWLQKINEKDTLGDFDYTTNEYHAKVILNSLSFLNSKGDEIALIDIGEKVKVHGILENDTNYAVIEWNGRYGIVEVTYLEKLLSIETLEDFEYSEQEYDATVITDLQFWNSKGETLFDVPTGVKVHVYGIWKEDKGRAVISYNEYFGIVDVEGLEEILEKDTLEDFEYSEEEYDATVITDLQLWNSKGEFLYDVPKDAIVHVYGIWKKNTKRAVISWNGDYGTVNLYWLEKIVKKDTLEDFEYSEKEYYAKVITDLQLWNSKGEFLYDVPKDAIVNVHGIWKKDTDRAVISWNGDYGTVRVKWLEKISTALSDYSFTGEKYTAQVVNYALGFRDKNSNLIVKIPIGEEVYVYGVYKGNTERAVICWNGIYGTVLRCHLYKIIKDDAEEFEYSGESYWAAVFEKDFLYLWDSNDDYIADVPANSLVWVYGEYDKDLKKPRTVINWNGKIGTVRSEFLIKLDDAVHVDIKKQKVTMFKNGKPLYYGDCVTGREQGKNPTPTRVGRFKIYNMVENVSLVGEGYEDGIPVDYWMPFDGGIGLHDSPRSVYGGNIYLKNGSHGCVNMPDWLAKRIYNNAYIGMSVHVSR